MLLRKGLYPYEYMDEWEKVNETTLLEKEEFYSNLNMDDITVYKDFEIKNVGEYHDLSLKGDTLLSAVFENLRQMCLEISQLDPV